MKHMGKNTALFAIGGLLYYMIEVVWRGHSHFSMFVLGGICFVLIGLINELFTYQMPLWKQQLLACAVITVFEFLAGVILNLWLKLDVWDYSALRFNLLGQISLFYCMAWFIISLPAIVLDDWLRFLIFDEEKPHYRII